MLELTGFIFTGTSKCNKAREKDTLQSNGQPKAINRGITPRRTKRASPNPSRNPSTFLRANQTQLRPPPRLERPNQRRRTRRRPKPLRRHGPSSSQVPLEERNNSPTNGDQEAERHRGEATEPMQYNAGPNGEAFGKKEGVF